MMSRGVARRFAASCETVARVDSVACKKFARRHGPPALHLQPHDSQHAVAGLHAQIVAAGFDEGSR